MRMVHHHEIMYQHRTVQWAYTYMEAVCRALMDMTPTQLYSVPQVCKAAQSLLDIHGEVGEEEIPLKVQEFVVRTAPLQIPSATAMQEMLRTKK